MFTHFPNDLAKDEKMCVCVCVTQISSRWTFSKNPSTAFCETVLSTRMMQVDKYVGVWMLVWRFLVTFWNEIYRCQLKLSLPCCFCWTKSNEPVDEVMGKCKYSSWIIASGAGFCPRKQFSVWHVNYLAYWKQTIRLSGISSTTCLKSYIYRVFSYYTYLYI